VRVGIEATGHARWFERLLAELQFELWIHLSRLPICIEPRIQSQLDLQDSFGSGIKERY
jgi:hypothetical protein